MSEPPRLVEVRQHVLKQNDVAARALRDRFREAGTYVVSLVSSPGSGKTAFLEKMLGRLRDRLPRRRPRRRPGDRQRRPPAGPQRRPGQADHHRDRLPPRGRHGRRGPGGLGPAERLDFLFIENVGNLVCPATFDLGEDLRLVLFSVTEGEDKPLKYPTIFNTADVALITKIDLAAAVEFDAAAAHRSIQSVRPGMDVFELSAKTGEGMEHWLETLQARRAAALLDREAPQAIPSRASST